MKQCTSPPRTVPQVHTVAMNHRQIDTFLQTSESIPSPIKPTNRVNVERETLKWRFIPLHQHKSPPPERFWVHLTLALLREEAGSPPPRHFQSFCSPWFCWKAEKGEKTHARVHRPFFGPLFGQINQILAFNLLYYSLVQHLTFIVCVHLTKTKIWDDTTMSNCRDMRTENNFSDDKVAR